MYVFVLGYSVSLCCSVNCLCVNVYCTTATRCQPNCSQQIYHIIIIIKYQISCTVWSEGTASKVKGKTSPPPNLPFKLLVFLTGRAIAGRWCASGCLAPTTNLDASTMNSHNIQDKHADKHTIRYATSFHIKVFPLLKQLTFRTVYIYIYVCVCVCVCVYIYISTIYVKLGRSNGYAV